MNIYISNLDAQLKNEDLKKLFATHGQVESVEIAIDAFTDLPRGFGHVEMPSADEARAAISALNQSELNGKVIEVKEVEPKDVRKGSYKVGNGAVNTYRFKKN
jgi:RNA recognition motif-containing protein